MSRVEQPNDLTIVRIRHENGAVVGTGFLVAPDLVCTCAHVVEQAVGSLNDNRSPLGADVALDFPFLPGQPRVSAIVTAWGPTHEDALDVAILRLTSPCPQPRVARLLSFRPLFGGTYRTYGFPAHRDQGVWSYGHVRDSVASGLIQIEADSTQGYPIQRGFSGAPVWDIGLAGVIGMVTAADTDPATRAAFLVPVERIRRLYPRLELLEFGRLFATLTDGLVGMPLTCMEQFLREYLGSATHPAPFGGRRAELEALDSWLASGTEPYALIAAEAGRGKSALLSRWALRQAAAGTAHVVFVPVSIRFGTALKTNVLSLLGARLAHLHNAQAPSDPESVLPVIDSYLRQARQADRPLIIIIDGVDEAVGWSCGRDFRLPPQPGANVRVVISARLLAGDRGPQDWVDRLEWRGLARTLTLEPLDYNGLAEALRSMGPPIDKLAHQPSRLRDLLRLSEGDPLIVRLYLEALYGAGSRAPFLLPEDLHTLEPGLENYFNRWLKEQRQQWGQASIPVNESAARSLLDLLACAMGPLSTGDILNLTAADDLDAWRLQEALGTLDRFVIGDGQQRGFVFSHPRLAAFFFDRLTLQQREKWHSRILSYCRTTLSDLNERRLAPPDASPYVVQSYGAHLDRSGASDLAFYELISEGWLRAWEVLDRTYSGFLTDALRTWKRADARGDHLMQLRCALVRSSVASLSGRLPIELLKLALTYAVITSAQAIQLIQQIGEERQRSAAVQALAPFLADTFKTPALADALLIADPGGRASALLAIALALSDTARSDALSDASRSALQITDPSEKALLLSQIALAGRNMPGSRSLSTALQSLRAVQDPVALVRLRCTLAERVPSHVQALLLRQATNLAAKQSAAARRYELLLSVAVCAAALQRSDLAVTALTHISEGDDLGRAIAEVAPRIAPSARLRLLHDALVQLESISKIEYLATALISLAPVLAENGYADKALEVTHALNNRQYRDAVVERLAPTLARIGLTAHALRALEISSPEHRPKAAFDTARYLPKGAIPDLRAQGLGMVRGKQIDGLPQPLYHSLARALASWGDISEGLLALRHEHSIDIRAQALVDFLRLPTLTVNEREEILSDAASAASDAVRQGALAAVAILAEIISDGDRRILVTKIQNVEDPSVRSRLLSAVAPCLSPRVRDDALRDALSASRVIHDTLHVSAALSSVAHLLADFGYYPEALQATAYLRGTDRLDAILSLGHALPREHAAAALRELLPTNEPSAVLRHLTQPRQVLEAFRVLLRLGATNQVATLILSLSPGAYIEVLPELLAAVSPAFAHRTVAEALARLAPDNLTAREGGESRHLPDRYTTDILLAIAPFVPATLMAEFESLIEAGVGQDAASELIEPLATRYAALGNVDRAVHWARRGLAPESHVAIMLLLADSLPDSRRMLALNRAVDAVADPASSGVWATIALLAPRLAAYGLSGQGVALADAMPDPAARTDTLVSVALASRADLRPAILTRVLDEARLVAQPRSRAALLARLVMHLDEPAKTEASQLLHSTALALRGTTDLGVLRDVVRSLAGCQRMDDAVLLSRAVAAPEECGRLIWEIASYSSGELRIRLIAEAREISGQISNPRRRHAFTQLMARDLAGRGEISDLHALLRLSGTDIASDTFIADIAVLLARSGHCDEALRLVETLGTPQASLAALSGMMTSLDGETTASAARLLLKALSALPTSAARLTSIREAQLPSCPLSSPELRDAAEVLWSASLSSSSLQDRARFLGDLDALSALPLAMGDSDFAAGLCRVLTDTLSWWR